MYRHPARCKIPCCRDRKLKKIIPSFKEGYILLPLGNVRCFQDERDLPGILLIRYTHHQLIKPYGYLPVDQLKRIRRLIPAHVISRYLLILNITLASYGIDHILDIHIYIRRIGYLR